MSVPCRVSCVRYCKARREGARLPCAPCSERRTSGDSKPGTRDRKPETGNRPLSTGHRLGQAVSIDLVLGMVGFLLVLTYALSAYNDQYAVHSSASERRQLELAALSLSDALVRTPGSPANWTGGVKQGGQNIEGLNSIGLADGWNVLDMGKVDVLDRVKSYSKLQEYLGLDNEFYLWIRYANGSDILVKGKQRKDWVGVTVDRVAAYNGRPALVSVTVYEVQP